MLKQRSNKKFHLKDGDVDGGGVQQLLLQLEVKQLAALSVQVPVLIVLLIVPLSVQVPVFLIPVLVQVPVFVVPVSVQSISVQVSVLLLNISTCSLKWKDWLYCGQVLLLTTLLFFTCKCKSMKV